MHRVVNAPRRCLSGCRTLRFSTALQWPWRFLLNLGTPPVGQSVRKILVFESSAADARKEMGRGIGRPGQRTGNASRNCSIVCCGGVNVEYLCGPVVRPRDVSSNQGDIRARDDHPNFGRSAPDAWGNAAAIRPLAWEPPPPTKARATGRGN
jgi:hypothetical protein